VDYGVRQAQTEYTLDFSEDADFPAQIQDIIDDATDIGVTITGMLTSRKNISKMRKNASLQTAINGTIGAGALVGRSALESYLSEEFGIDTIITNDLTYGASAVIGSDGRPSITRKRYFPDDKVTFFATNPGGRMGAGLWGNPPEIDAANFYQVNTATGVSPYVYVTQWMETDPAVLWTKASGLFMPVLYNPNSLFIATVDDTGA
jgi:2-polyprenyl-6-methoxyphenol hydroxylase-like FAD-dependent oxidoreductase